MPGSEAVTLPPKVVMAAAIAIERELLSGRHYAMAEDSDEALARAALEAAAPLLREQYADDLEAEGSPLCDCRHPGGSEPTNAITRARIAHHCECTAVVTSEAVRNGASLTRHGRECVCFRSEPEAMRPEWLRAQRKTTG